MKNLGKFTGSKTSVKLTSEVPEIVFCVFFLSSPFLNVFVDHFHQLHLAMATSIWTQKVAPTGAYGRL